MDDEISKVKLATGGEGKLLQELLHYILTG